MNNIIFFIIFKNIFLLLNHKILITLVSDILYFILCLKRCHSTDSPESYMGWYKVNAVRRKERGLPVLKQALYILEGEGCKSAEREEDHREQRAKISPKRHQQSIKEKEGSIECKGSLPHTRGRNINTYQVKEIWERKRIEVQNKTLWPFSFTTPTPTPTRESNWLILQHMW